MKVYSIEEGRKLLAGEGERIKAMGKQKYRNNKASFDGHDFDSEKERDRYIYLKSLLQQGKIKELKLQHSFSLDIKGEHICNYIADFTYQKFGNHPNDKVRAILTDTVVEDVKSEFTRKMPVYRLKKKLMKAILGIVIIEV